MAWTDWLKAIGGGVAAPFTGGATLPLALTGLTGLAGGLGNRAQTTNGQQNGTSNSVDNSSGSSNTSSLSSTNYNLDPNATQLNNSLTQNYMSLLNAQPNFEGFQAQGLGNINHVADLQKQVLNENLAQRGITGNAAGNAEAGVDNTRFGNVTNFLNTAPSAFMQQSLPLLNQAGGFSSSLPRNSTSSLWSNVLNNNANTQSSTSSGTSSQTAPGNVAGGTVTGLTAMLARLFGGNSATPNSGDFSQGYGY